MHVLPELRDRLRDAQRDAIERLHHDVNAGHLDTRLAAARILLGVSEPVDLRGPAPVHVKWEGDGVPRVLDEETLERAHQAIDDAALLSEIGRLRDERLMSRLRAMDREAEGNDPLGVR